MVSKKKDDNYYKIIIQYFNQRCNLYNITNSNDLLYTNMQFIYNTLNTYTELTENILDYVLFETNILTLILIYKAIEHFLINLKNQHIIKSILSQTFNNKLREYMHINLNKLNLHKNIEYNTDAVLLLFYYNIHNEINIYNIYKCDINIFIIKYEVLIFSLKYFLKKWKSQLRCCKFKQCNNELAEWQYKSDNVCILFCTNCLQYYLEEEQLNDKYILQNLFTFYI